MWVTAAAPRYDDRIRAAIWQLDDRREPIAEVCRRVAGRAEQLGLPRPSYVHVRRLVRAERRRRDELKALLASIADDIAAHRPVDAYRIAAEIQDIEAGFELRRGA